MHTLRTRVTKHAFMHSIQVEGEGGFALCSCSVIRVLRLRYIHYVMNVNVHGVDSNVLNAVSSSHFTMLQEHGYDPLSRSARADLCMRQQMAQF